MFSSPRVLFICVHNGGRSQMCEAFLKHYADDRFDAQSAGLEPGELNPLAVEAMAEIGIDISRNQNVGTTSINQLDYVSRHCRGSRRNSRGAGAHVAAVAVW